MRETIDRRTSPVTGHRCRVVAGALGGRAEVLGAIARVMRAASAPE